MPTKKTRMALTIPDDLMAVLRDFAEAQEKPMASVVVALLEEMKPQLESLTKINRALKAGKTSVAKSALRSMVGDAMAEAMAQAQPDMFKKAKK